MLTLQICIGPYLLLCVFHHSYLFCVDSSSSSSSLCTLIPSFGRLHSWICPMNGEFGNGCLQLPVNETIYCVFVFCTGHFGFLLWISGILPLGIYFSCSSLNRSGSCPKLFCVKLSWSDLQTVTVCLCCRDRSRPRTYCLADSDEESSSAGSSDEEDPPELLSDKPNLPASEGWASVSLRETWTQIWIKNCSDLNQQWCFKALQVHSPTHSLQVWRLAADLMYHPVPSPSPLWVLSSRRCCYE